MIKVNKIENIIQLGMNDDEIDYENVSELIYQEFEQIMGSKGFKNQF